LTSKFKRNWNQRLSKEITPNNATNNIGVMVCRMGSVKLGMQKKESWYNLDLEVQNGLN
jgi:hypothetical protein